METLNRAVVLNTMIKHETLIIHDISKEENPGFVADKDLLQFLLDELTESGHLIILAGATPYTYTINEKGIIEAKRLSEQL